jgi:hypothetical protein
MIEGLSTVPYIYNLNEILSSAKRVTVPVRPLYTPALVFRHVIGVPAHSDDESVPLYKVQLLNNLIEGLSKAERIFPGKRADTNTQTEDIDMLLTSLGERMRQSAKAPTPYGTGLRLEPGILVNLTV